MADGLTTALTGTLVSAQPGGNCEVVCTYPKYEFTSTPSIGSVVSPNASMVMFYYFSTGITRRIEYLVYDFSAIVAAVGGSMGLFLGFSCHDGIKRLLYVLN